jgi:phosphoadenosine phosphosulfate reductase
MEIYSNHAGGKGIEVLWEMRNLFGNIPEIAIDRLRTFEQSALAKSPDGYYVAYSGGKDSDVILDLVRRSGVKYTAHHNLTTCDPPELVCHVKEQPDVEIIRPEMTMWQLIKKKGQPPRRNARYCCTALKEYSGKGRIVITGVRWGESVRRSKRRMLETCYRSKTKQYLNIIIDWSSNDVWRYIRNREIDYCKLYDEGFKRLGCVLCPMNREVKRDMERWPQIARAWERAIKAAYNPDKHKERYGFNSPEEYWQWWIDRDRSSGKQDETMMFFED